MVPFDSEFTLLYIGYGILASILLLCILLSNKKKTFIASAAALVAYTALEISNFADKENFKYGGSLPVLFYAGLLLLAQFLVLGIAILISRRT